MGNETLFLSSTLVLLAMACSSLLLACLFRMRFRRLDGIAGDPSVKVFNRTFNVFDPYPDRLKLIGNFVTVLPLVVLALTGAVLLFVMEIVATGLLLSLVVIVVSLNLLVVEGAFDIYQSAKAFTKAFQKGAGLGEGDLQVFRIVEKALPRLSNYYFGLATGFALLGLALPYAAPSLVWASVQFMSLIFSGGAVIGFAPLTIPLIWMLSVVIIVIFIRRIKSRFSRTIFAQPLELP